jgi:RHH-type transcriptional regulator, proline utilization regulon repressor / proline dehydrogenase / delta 1-pyrroline-5-carboxylate dehydrogenase
VPGDALQLLPGDGSTGRRALVADPRIAGVAFTGSTETARRSTGAGRARRADRPLIAETGGQNAMIVDSSALPEQVVATPCSRRSTAPGQRCSALRVLFLQEDIADRKVLDARGAPWRNCRSAIRRCSTDVGPVIDGGARHARGARERMAPGDAGARRCRCRRRPARHFFAPRPIEIDGSGVLEREVFGPILHVVRYRAPRLDR